MNTAPAYRVKYDPRDSCYRIHQQTPAGRAMLGWLRFATPKAAESYIELHGLPPVWRLVAVKGYTRRVLV